MPYQYYQYVHPNRQLPFLATLDLPDLSKLINDPIRHNPSWPPILVKLPSDIPKFDGKQGEDPRNYVMTFHFLSFYFKKKTCEDHNEVPIELHEDRSMDIHHAHELDVFFNKN